jgi:hypothetical protein
MGKSPKFAYTLQTESGAPEPVIAKRDASPDTLHMAEKIEDAA